MEAAIQAILADPGRYQPVGDRTRVFRLKRFPDLLFYRFDELPARVRIVAVLHRKRRPDSWRERS